MNETIQTPPFTQPTLIEADPSIRVLHNVTGKCDRCLTCMPQHALRIVGTFAGISKGLRCVNTDACADRERKMIARHEELARDWAIGGVA